MQEESVVTIPATDATREQRAGRASILVATAGVVGSFLGAIVGRVLSNESFPPNWLAGFTRCSVLASVFAPLPFLWLARRARRSVRECGHLSPLLIGALIAGVLASSVLCAALFSDGEGLAFATLTGVGEVGLVIIPGLAMLLGSGIGWVVQWVASKS